MRLNRRITYTGLVGVCLIPVLTKVVELLNGSTEDFITGAFGCVAIFAVTSGLMTHIWRPRRCV